MEKGRFWRGNERGGSIGYVGAESRYDDERYGGRRQEKMRGLKGEEIQGGGGDGNDGEMVVVMLVKKAEKQDVKETKIVE